MSERGFFAIALGELGNARRAGVALVPKRPKRVRPSAPLRARSEGLAVRGSAEEGVPRPFRVRPSVPRGAARRLGDAGGAQAKPRPHIGGSPSARAGAVEITTRCGSPRRTLPDGG